MAKELKKINFNIPLIDLKGEPVENPKMKRGVAMRAPSVDGKPGEVIWETLVVKDLIANALLARSEGDKSTPKDILDRTRLAEYISTHSNGKYSESELEMIEEFVINNSNNHIISLRVQELIHGRLNEAEEE